MRRLRIYLWFSLIAGLLSGWVVGGMWSFQHALPTSDWAVNGVPLWERWWQKGAWFLEGFLPAAAIGFVAGPFLYHLIPSDDWINADPTGARRKWVSRIGSALTYIFFGVLIVHFVWVMSYAL